MRPRSSPNRSFRGLWFASWALPAALQISSALVPGLPGLLGSPVLLFWTVVVAAGACVVTSAWVVRRSFVTGEADLGALGMFSMSVSILPLVHGLTTPGVLYGDNAATSVSVFLAVPVGLASVAPFAFGSTRATMWIRRRWRGWVLGWMGAAGAASVSLLVSPDIVPSPRPRDPFVVAVAVASFIGCILSSRRHLRMARISGRSGTLVVSAGIGLVGASSFVWLVETPLVFGFWVAHAIDVTGVLAATIGALVVYRRTSSVRDVLAPILAVEPLGALAVGLDPVVHRFIADLDAKDPITRDHVVRTAALAIRVGEELHLDPVSLRRLGLTAMLHDVGKLEIPDHVIDKPGRLTDDEFDVIRTHPVIGERLVAATLPEIGAGIRAHHERIDGGGYPDGLVGHDIPFDARVVAVCDSFDAMANTRQYRRGMGREMAVAILREHAGTQWDEAIVATLVAVVERDAAPIDALAFDSVGRGPDADRDVRVGCDCLPALSV